MDALRHGWPLAIEGAPLLQPVETAFGELAGSAMLISATRAATLKLANQIEAAAPRQPVLMRGADPFDLPAALAVADPALDMASPLKGPFKAMALEWEEQARAALDLARLAGVLPAFLVDPENAGEAVPLKAADVGAFTDAARLQIASRARLPVAAADDARIVAFRSPDDTREHVALIIGEQSADRIPLVRLHSECLTGDILGSLKCDCGPQLAAALQAMAQEADRDGWGILLYMRQEGRGIGIINKLRAYTLQDQGYDTMEANRRLGFENDERIFQPAAEMLSHLGFTRIRLMTNNPGKISGLTRLGIDVVERVPHAFAPNTHNQRYLDTKARHGHQLW